MAEHDENAKRAPEDVRAAVRDELDRSGASQAELARQAGISDAALSQFLSGTYQGDNARVAEALASCLDVRARRGALPEIVTGNPFLDTRASLRVLDALGFVHDTCGIALVTGRPGVGKTYAAREYARRTRNVWHVTILEGGGSPVRRKAR